jgi:hypothetical protein
MVRGRILWGDTPGVWQIGTDAGCSLEDLSQQLGRLELQA